MVGQESQRTPSQPAGPIVAISWNAPETKDDVDFA